MPNLHVKKSPTLSGQLPVNSLSTWSFPDLPNEPFSMGPQIMNPYFKAMIPQKLCSQSVILEAHDPQTST